MRSPSMLTFKESRRAKGQARERVRMVVRVEPCRVRHGRHLPRAMRVSQPMCLSQCQQHTSALFATCRQHSREPQQQEGPRSYSAWVQGSWRARGTPMIGQECHGQLRHVTEDGGKGDKSFWKKGVGRASNDEGSRSPTARLRPCARPSYRCARHHRRRTSTEAILV